MRWYVREFWTSMEANGETYGATTVACAGGGPCWRYRRSEEVRRRSWLGNLFVVLLRDSQYVV